MLKLNKALTVLVLIAFFCSLLPLAAFAEGAADPNGFTLNNVSGATGTYKYEDGKYVITNAGSDVFEERMDFTFVGKQVQAKEYDNIVATMKVDSQTFESLTHLGASAALTLWNGDSTPDGMVIYTVGNSGNGVRYVFRNSFSRANPQGTSRTNLMETWNDKSEYPVEFKLEKKGYEVYAYYKKDGQGDWILLSDGRTGKFANYEGGDNPYIGIKVTGGTKGEDGTPNMTAVISDFKYTITPGDPSTPKPAMTPVPTPTPTPEPKNDTTTKTDTPAKTPVGVYVGNTLIKSKGATEDTLLAESNAFAKAIKAVVAYSGNTVTFTKTMGKVKYTVVLTVNSKTAKVNGKASALTAAPTKTGNSYFVPAKSLAKLLKVKSVAFKEGKLTITQ